MSAYERDAKRPNKTTLTRLQAAIAAGSASVIHTSRLLTVPGVAAAIRSGLREGRSSAEMLRLVRQMRADSSQLESAADHAAFFAAPTTTGDRRWDLLVAGVVESMFLEDGGTPPTWVGKGTLDTFWFLTPSPGLDAYVFARSPISLQVRGIMVDPADLAAV